MGKTIAIDSSLFIYLLENHEIYADRCDAILKKVVRGEVDGLLASLGLAEIMTGPKKIGHMEEAYKIRDYILNFPNLSLVHTNLPIIDLASDLRAYYHLNTPDAIHLASAIVYGADVFITNDKALKKVKEIAIQLL